MSNENTKFDPSLLEQRIAQLERMLSSETDKVNKLEKETSESRGRTGLMSAILPLAIALGGMVFGTVIYSQQATTSGMAHKNEITIAELRKDVSQAVIDRGDIHRRKQMLRDEFEKHEAETGHPRIEERLKVIESALSSDDLWQTDTIKSLTSVQATASQNQLSIKAHEDDIDKLVSADDQSQRDRTTQASLMEQALISIRENAKDIEKNQALATHNERSMSKVAATADAHMKEKETQIRAAFENITALAKNNDRIVSMIWEKVFEIRMPDYDHTNSDIPARATSTLGEIRTNGN